MTFEEKLNSLQNIVSRLEDENIPLEEAVKLYEQAKALSNELSKELDESIKKMAYIVENDQVKQIDEKNEEKDV